MPLATPLAERLSTPVIAILALAASLWLTASAHAEGVVAPARTAGGQGLVSEAAQPAAGRASLPFDGVVEAVRQTVVSAQVPGAVLQLLVKVGDRVQAGQVLLRLDARAADQGVAAGDAQVAAARASLDLASRDLERQRQLARQRFISQAALDRAESEFAATAAQVKAQIAQAGIARTQTSFNLVRAPYAGVVTEVPVALGDMAMPGRPLVTLYDPAALRVSASVPQSVAARLSAGVLPRVEVPGLPPPGPWLTPLNAQRLPTVDASTHTVLLRADLPPAVAGGAGLAPGMFARLWLPVDRAATPGDGNGNGDGGTAIGRAGASPSVLQRAIVRRAELTGLYVLDAGGQARLRQVRLGRASGDRVEVLSGLALGEQVVTDPQTALRAAPAASGAMR